VKEMTEENQRILRKSCPNKLHMHCADRSSDYDKLPKLWHSPTVTSDIQG